MTAIQFTPIPNYNLHSCHRDTELTEKCFFNKTLRVSVAIFSSDNYDIL